MVVSLASFQWGGWGVTWEIEQPIRALSSLITSINTGPRFRISSFPKWKNDFLFFRIFDFFAIYYILYNNWNYFDLSRYFQYYRIHFEIFLEWQYRFCLRNWFILLSTRLFLPYLRESKAEIFYKLILFLEIKPKRYFLSLPGLLYCHSRPWL